MRAPDPHGVGMRIALITESFPPDVNGVAHSVVRVAEHLVRRGHQPLVVAPGRPDQDDDAAGYPVLRVPSVAMPGYRGFRLGLPTPRLVAALRDHGTELVHLASPFFFGAAGTRAAQRLGLPTVAVYQTDIPSYARLYRFHHGAEMAWRWLSGIHNAAALTLAPSQAAVADLHAHGVQRVRLWRRGVDTARFHPDHRDEALRATLAPAGEVIVGYVGRLAVEKRVDLLAPVCALPGVRVVVVGDGPAGASLRRALPTATFLGARHGDELARIFASLDLFVHTGPYETFGQTVQEAQASGVPVVAPARGGPLDLVRPGTGFLVPPLDPAALLDAVHALTGNPDRRRRFGAAGRRLVAGRSWAAVGDELIGHYRAVLAGHGTPATGVQGARHAPGTAPAAGAATAGAAA